VPAGLVTCLPDWQAGSNKKDRDSADYTTTIWTNQFYLCTFFWLFDAVVHAAYQVAVGLSPLYKDWDKYKPKNYGHCYFQIELAIALMNYAVELDWKDPDNESTKPAGMCCRQLIPCNCGKCFFCANALTNGIDHKVPGHPAAEYHEIITSKQTTRYINFKYCSFLACQHNNKSGPQHIHKSLSTSIKQNSLPLPACCPPSSSSLVSSRYLHFGMPSSSYSILLSMLYPVSNRQRVNGPPLGLAILVGQHIGRHLHALSHQELIRRFEGARSGLV